MANWIDVSVSLRKRTAHCSRRASGSSRALTFRAFKLDSSNSSAYHSRLREAMERPPRQSCGYSKGK